MPSTKGRYKNQGSAVRPGTVGQSLGNDDDIQLVINSPYADGNNMFNNNNNGSVILRKRSGTSHAHKSSFKSNGNLVG